MKVLLGPCTLQHEQGGKSQQSDWLCLANVRTAVLATSGYNVATEW